MAAAFGKFSEKDDDGDPAASTGSTSLVGRGTELTGDLVGRGQLRVEGRVDGTIRMDGEVHVAADGAVEGRIEADEVVAAGRVSGTIAAREAVRLEEGCRVEADVRCPVLELEEGGHLDGRVEMSGEGLPESEEAAAGAAGPRPTSSRPAERDAGVDGDVRGGGETAAAAEDTSRP